MSKAGTIIVTIISVILIGAIIFFGFTPGGRSVWNSYTHSLEKADENQYETKKQVEDTARSMIASYKSDVATYEQYKDSDNEEKQSWAEQAKMRANRTANSYNEYILKNSYVWEDNIPSDIDYSLPIVE
ncbi:putative uncharacterized protein [Clostridium sp. CAG:793]|jgi:hypothetical protein|nr:putative uncharacterized protein [Clostridium sp. CAG:793]